VQLSETPRQGDRDPASGDDHEQADVFDDQR
jgi:hypothetical protein